MVSWKFLNKKDEKNKWFLGKIYHDTSIIFIIIIIIIIIRNANFFLYQVPINLANNIKGCSIFFYICSCVIYSQILLKLLMYDHPYYGYIPKLNIYIYISVLREKKNRL